jgi:hypothetical protein
MTEDDIRELFREMKDEPVPPDSLVRMRQAVAARTVARGCAPWWKFAAGLIAVASVVLVILLSRAGGPVRQSAPSPPPLISASKPIQPLPRPAKEPDTSFRVRSARREPPSADTVLIRIETPDPDVVILLLGEERGS